MAKSTSQRRTDLTAARDHYRRRPKALLTLDELAELYGLTKPAFVNLRKTIEDFPGPAKRDGNAYFYPAFKSVAALLAYVTRHEEQKMDHGRRFNALVRAPGGEADHAGISLTAQEQLRAYELRQRLIDEAIQQGQLHRTADCARTTEKVFSLISSLFGQPTATMDPSGKWPADVRKAVDEAGRQLVLKLFGELKDMLAEHADQQPDRPSPDGTGRPRARRVAKAGNGAGSVAAQP